MATKPPISRTVKAIATQLKYLLINAFILGPSFQIRNETRKNLAPRLMIEATRNITMSMLNAPDEIVITL